jgi:hypothetical protein
LREVFGEISPNADPYDIAVDLSEKVEMKDRLNSARTLIIDDGELDFLSLLLSAWLTSW